MLKSIILIAALTLFMLPVQRLRGEELPYSIGYWPADTLGNHRVVLRVTDDADAVWAHIPWRRRDLEPGKKNLILVDAATGEQVKNLFPVEINRDYGDVVFQPVTVPGDYYLYYLPHKASGSKHYPTVTYPGFKKTARPSWLARHGLSDEHLSALKRDDFPQAECIAAQAVDDFNAFYPMEVIATEEEVQELLNQHPGAGCLLFPEDRKHPIRMTGDLSLKWIKTGPQKTFEAYAARGEFYAFQIGVFACRTAIEDVAVRFTALKNPVKDRQIPAYNLRCFNLNGVDWKGKLFDKVFAVEKGKVRALWFGVQIPEDIPPGDYTGTVTVAPTHAEEGSVTVVMKVTEEILDDRGDSEPWKHSRLRWLNSMIALDNGVIPPYVPMKMERDTVSCLGRKVRIDDMGFPESIQSFFAPEVTHLSDRGRELLAAPVRLVVEDRDGKALSWEGEGWEIDKYEEGALSWSGRYSAGSLTMGCLAQMEFDGHLAYRIAIHADRRFKVKDIRLELPIAQDGAKYMMGMGFKGGLRPDRFWWKWDPNYNQDALWVGDVNGGIQCRLFAENYRRPLNTNFYLLKPLEMPPSWHNGGKGGLRAEVMEGGQTEQPGESRRAAGGQGGETEPPGTAGNREAFLVTAYSGARTLKAGETLQFNFDLLLTPFKPLDTEGHWRTRYYHRYEPLDAIAATGANTINVHHATEINPYINYPFLRTAEMKAYIDAAHARNMKVKIYYTVRELSNRAPELFALRSLGDEILAGGPGGGFAWLQEHLGGDYINGWFVPEYQDAAVINSGTSRWHNYYLEGLSWLVKNVGIDGLYIDDVAFDREVMKRVRKILDRGRPEALIDLHSANQYNERDGYASSTNLYLEHFPYLNRIWFGEYFDYDARPDYWLVEMSGIPFGVMGEMLQDGGNPWRGMLYGMTSRLPWAGDPRPVWKVWDDFGIDKARMIGYWAPRCPVKTDRPDVMATAYVRIDGEPNDRTRGAGEGQDHSPGPRDLVLIALASWATGSSGGAAAV